MAFDFSGDWAAEIAEVSDDPEYMRCTVQVRDPSRVVRVRDIITGETLNEGDPVVFESPARIVGIRAALDILAGTSANPSGDKNVRVQFPYEKLAEHAGRISRGWQIRVLDGGRNPALTKYLLTVASDFNSSNVANPVLECAIALDNDPGWT